MTTIQSECIECGHPFLVNFPDATPAPLDVERLRKAIHEQCARNWREIAATDPDRQVTQHLDDIHQRYAEAIAAEYARLTEADR